MASTVRLDEAPGVDFRQTRIVPPSALRGRILIVMAPVLGLAAFTALMAVAIGLSGWYRDEMLTAGAGAGVLVAAVAIALLLLRIGERSADRRALQNVEARVGGIVESAMDPIISIDEAQKVVLFNAAAEAVFGRPRSAVLGQPLDMLLPARFRSAPERLRSSW